jgi:hypothetical protein
MAQANRRAEQATEPADTGLTANRSLMGVAGGAAPCPRSELVNAAGVSIVMCTTGNTSTLRTTVSLQLVVCGDVTVKKAP